MTEIPLKVTATMAEQLLISNFLSVRTAGRRRLIASLLFIIAGAMAGGLGAAALLKLPLGMAAIVSGYALLGAAGSFNLIRWINARRYTATLSTSALRGKPYAMILSADGVTLPERHHPWQDFSGLTRYKSFTVLLSSGADGLVIPDRDLPAGVTPEDFAKLVAQWRPE